MDLRSDRGRAPRRGRWSCPVPTRSRPSLAMDEADPRMDEMTAAPVLAFAGHGPRLVKAIPRHSHGSPILIWYTHGRGRLSWDGGVIPFVRGTVVCVPATLPYAEDSVAGFMSLYLAVTGLRL